MQRTVLKYGLSALTVTIICLLTVHPFLSVNRAITSEVLIIEGWLPPEALEVAVAHYQAGAYRQVFVTGQTFPEDAFYRIAHNGVLIIPLVGQTVTEVRLEAYSTPAFDHYAEMTVVVDSVRLGTVTTSATPSVYTFVPEVPLNAEYLSIHFDNDAVDPSGGDRDLYIRRLWLNGTEVPVRQPGSRFVTSHRTTHVVASQADAAAHYLIEAGIPAAVIYPVTSPRQLRSRTQLAAEQLAYDIKNRGQVLTSATIISQGVHARRSLLTYRRALPETDLGIVALPNLTYDATWWWFSARGWQAVIGESARYLYTLFAG
jgi:hypothetical protein